MAVRADDLSLAYGPDVAVSGATFELPVGGILGIVGEAGSGKSTLARAVAAQSAFGEGATPEVVGGRLEVLGHDIVSSSARRQAGLALRVGYLPQD
ncbi:ATP-binding cassette domain-containing protein, partial [Mesorhizobium japonicum]|uniref:ATP-binding cassette domain-containing protein n=1 Tax=Mesorhizobium japonicum TaxID=2066070 RepID=UPI003B59E197